MYHVHWNNLVDPITYRIDVPDGWEITPSEGNGPNVKVDADMDSREFLVDVIADDVTEQIGLTVRYFACSDQWCKPVTQTYTIQLVEDRDAGRTFGRDRGRSAGMDPRRRFRESDTDGDGRLSRAEAPDRMLEMFDRMDADGDGYVDESEMRRSLGARGMRPSGRGRGDFPDRLTRFDTDGDDRISREEMPDPMLERFDGIDTDGNGFIDPPEMGRMSPPGGGGRGGGNLESRVDRFMESDGNDDGKISREEAPERMLGMFDRFDSNSDGFLDRQEIRNGFNRFQRPGTRAGAPRDRI